MTPYEVLRVKKKATAEQVTRAFRKRSMETHPDRGGDAAELQAVVRAYRLLIDPAARKRYDQTGEVPGDEVNNADAELCTAIAGAFAVAAEHCLNTGKDPARVDLAHLMLASLNDADKRLRKNCADNKKIVDFITAAMGRFTGDGGELLLAVLGGQLARLKNDLTVMGKRLELNARAVEHLKKVGYRYEREMQGWFDSDTRATCTVTTY